MKRSLINFPLSIVACLLSGVLFAEETPESHFNHQRRLFMTVFDVDHDGFLTVKEREAMRKSPKKESSGDFLFFELFCQSEDLRAAMPLSWLETFDSDGDKRLSRAEGGQAMSHAIQQTRSRFDHDHSGQLVGEEITSLAEFVESGTVSGWDLGIAQMILQQSLPQNGNRRPYLEPSQKVWLSFDTDGNGRASVSELKQIRASNSKGSVADLVINKPSLQAAPSTLNFEKTAEVVDGVRLNQERGIFEDPFKVEMRSATKGAVIRYTTDGSIPTESSGLVYLEPIQIDRTTVIRSRAFKDTLKPSEVITHSFLFLQDVIKQSPDGLPPAGFPYHWGKNRANYGMDPLIANDSTYREELIQGLASIPSVSISTDMDNLFHPQTGIYANADQDGRDWERPASVEMIKPDRALGFQIDCGIRIRGGFSRMASNPKHAFRLFFRKEYGAAKLKFPLFGDNGAQEFDHLDLRCSSNYSWHLGNDERALFVRDQVNRDLQQKLGHPAMRGDFIHLYINGHYWGLYNTCERPKAGYGSQYLGGKKSNYDVIKQGGAGVIASDGNLDAWKSLYEKAKKGFSSNENYFAVQGMLPNGRRDPDNTALLDVDNLIDYMMIIFYGGNLDAPISWYGGNQFNGNWYAMRHRKRDHGFRFFIWDAEHTFLMHSMSQGLYEDRTGPFESGQDLDACNPQWLWQQCLENDEFRVKAADRIHTLFTGNGLMTPDSIHSILEQRANEIESAVIAESARWGDVSYGVKHPSTRDDHWRPELNRILNEYIPKRTEIVYAQLYRQGLVPDFDPPLVVRHENDLVLESSNGTVWYTLNDSDPRSIGGAISKDAIQYTEPIKFQKGIALIARVHYRNEWSVMTKFTDEMRPH